MLGLWIVWILAIIRILVAIEFVRESLERQQFAHEYGGSDIALAPAAAQAQAQQHSYSAGKKSASASDTKKRRKKGRDGLVAKSSALIYRARIEA